LLYKLAQAYYVDGLTQQEIAGRFGISRPKVSRMLQQGREEGVINISLVPPPSGTTDLERALERSFGLEEAVVVTVDDADDQSDVARRLGPAAAETLIRCIHGSEVVGLTWGTSLLHMVHALPVKFFPDVTVVQILGGLGPVGEMEHSTELVQMAAKRLNARLRLLPAPGIVTSREAFEALKSDNQISETLALAVRSDIVLVGLGLPSHESILIRDGNIITQKDLALIKEAGGIGDVVLRFINSMGEPIDLAINDRIIGLTLDQIKAVPRVIAVAGGMAKYKLIRAALRGRIMNVLVTDHITAEHLLEEAKGS
jgi:DNA-binding transcriptional regulator LsrR (DeoR family)